MPGEHFHFTGEEAETERPTLFLALTKLSPEEYAKYLLLNRDVKLG